MEPGAERTTEATEAELIAALQRGDEQAYERMVRWYGGRLLNTARRLLGNEEDARDALQDAFVSAFRAMERFDARAKLSTWLHRIVINTALMKLRQRKRRPEEPIDPLLPPFDDAGHHVVTPGRWRDPADIHAQRELRGQVRAAIDRLPDSYRTVLLLRDIEQLDTEETANLLQISANAVKVRLHRARLALRQILDPGLREAEP